MNKETNTETISSKMGEAARNMKEAAEVAGEQTTDYLSDAWEQVKDGAYDTKDTLVAGYERSLQTAREAASDWKREFGDGKEAAVGQLQMASDKAERELEKLKLAGEEHWDDARRSFNAAWRELKRGMVRAREKLRK